MGMFEDMDDETVAANMLRAYERERANPTRKKTNMQSPNWNNGY